MALDQWSLMLISDILDYLNWKEQVPIEEQAPAEGEAERLRWSDVANSSSTMTPLQELDVSPAPPVINKTWKEQRLHETGAIESPEDWIWVKHRTHSDWYRKGIVQQFAKAAKKYGIDPYTYVALGISETGLGNLGINNPARIDLGQHGRALSKYPREWSDTDRNIDFGAAYLAEQFKKYPKDKLSAVQAYSGEGKTIYGGNAEAVKMQSVNRPVLSLEDLNRQPTTKVFGRDFRKINFWKEKPQAKRVINIERNIRENPEIRKLIEIPTWSSMVD